jgi:LmbE family N-acetylglucosaminyl deacetylase
VAGDRLVVIAPHLDDAALSLGAAISRATRCGVRVEVLTVFAGDVHSSEGASPHDRASGFAAAGQAAAVRRQEDLEACAHLGAVPVWLPFDDGLYEGTPGDEELAEAVAQSLGDPTGVLVPGWPLVQPDHVRAARLVVQRVRPSAPLGLYVEQPYAAFRRLSRTTVVSGRGAPARQRPVGPASVGLDQGSPWARAPARPADWRAKLHAVRAYRSQLPGLRRWPIARIALDEATRGGERVSWIGG